jgi:hypothetical protein
VVVKTKNRGGSALQKGFTVYTNDPANRAVKLKLSGRVKAYVSIAPRSVRLFGNAGLPLSSTIQILPVDGHQFSIKEVTARTDKHLLYQVKPMDAASGKKGYLLLVENTMKEPGVYRDTILIKTDSRQKPELRIPVYGRIRAPSASGEHTPK